MRTRPKKKIRFSSLPWRLASGPTDRGSGDKGSTEGKQRTPIPVTPGEAKSGDSSARDEIPKELTPRQIVRSLDRYVIGQTGAKRAVAIALRNRWRRGRIEEDIREEIVPNNIILIYF